MAWRYRARRVPWRRRCRRRRRRRRSWQRDQEEEEEEEEEEDLGSARGVAIPRARTKYLTLTIGETRCSLYTRLTSRLENIAASCYLHSPIEPATARGMRVIVSRLPPSSPLCLSFLSLSVLSRPPPRFERLLLSVFGARWSRDSGRAMRFLERGFRFRRVRERGIGRSLIKFDWIFKERISRNLREIWKCSINRLSIETIIKNVWKEEGKGLHRVVSTFIRTKRDKFRLLVYIQRNPVIVSNRI